MMSLDPRFEASSFEYTSADHTAEHCPKHTCHILPPSEIELGLFLAVFAGLEGRYLFHRIGWKGRIWQLCQCWHRRANIVASSLALVRYKLLHISELTKGKTHWNMSFKIFWNMPLTATGKATTLWTMPLSKWTSIGTCHSDPEVYALHIHSV